MKKYLLLLLFLLFSIFYVKAQNNKVLKLKRPKIGLVLSGGGAKGFAYIGLLKVLEEVHLHIDYIAGTSIGSIIGGLYAAGYSPDTIAQIIRLQNWDNLLNDNIERKYINFEDKVYGEKYIVDLPLNKNSVSLKASLHEGQQINLLLNRLFSPFYNISNFSKLPTPFLCIGTNLLSGEAVELDSGYLAMAIRASMSIPGFFSPTFYNGKYLIDGGVINNFPVINVKNKGVKYVIGGDVQSGLIKNPDKLDKIITVLDQVISFNREAANKAAYKETDMLIHFKINYGIMDFNNYDSLIAIGERTARAHYSELKALSDSLNAIKYVPVVKRNTHPIDSLYIDKIVIHGLQNIHSKYIMNFFKDIIHKQITLHDLEKRITTTYGTNYFDHVFYKLQPSGKHVTLILNIKEKSLGTIRAGIHYDNDYLGSLMVSTTFRNLLPSTKLYTDIVLGPNPRFRSLFLIDNGKVLGLGAKLNFYNFNFDFFEKSVKTNRIQFINYSASLFANKTLKNFYNFRAGFEYEDFKFKYQYNDIEMSNRFDDFNSYGNFFVSFRSDTYDNPLFPTKGFKSAFVVKYVFPFSTGWTSDFFSKSLISYFIYDHAISLTPKLVIKPGVFLGATLKSEIMPPLQHFFALGGLNPSNYIEAYQPFTGLHFIQSYGMYVATGRLKLQYRFATKHYITLKADIGSISDTIEELSNPDMFLFGYGLTYSYNSFIGPVELTFMSSNVTKDFQVFLNIGYWF